MTRIIRHVNIMLFILGLVFVTSSHAADPCFKEFPEHNSIWRIWGRSSDKNECFLTVDRPGRSYRIYQNGAIGVENKIGSSILMQVYQIVPSHQSGLAPFAYKAGQSGYTISSPKQTNPMPEIKIGEGGKEFALENCRVKISGPTREQSGVDIQGCDNRLIFDHGYGGDKGQKANPNGDARVIDPSGSVCKLKNKDLLTYTNGIIGDILLKKKSELITLLKEKCPRLDIFPLLSGEEAPRPTSIKPSSSSDTGRR